MDKGDPDFWSAIVTLSAVFMLGGFVESARAPKRIAKTSMALVVVPIVGAVLGLTGLAANWGAPHAISVAVGGSVVLVGLWARHLAWEHERRVDKTVFKVDEYGSDEY
ncbi:hypothetical protein [Desertimonas flava]|uniref:hypothetical protein n=1 Tax=Desertimonas flava TaxID=2064846 RepID=UPI000E346237|nr:hypothetical protein [Desertimonas flava]